MRFCPMIDFLRRKMNCFIYAIVSAFVLSIFVGSASLLFFSPKKRPDDVPDALAKPTETPKSVDDEEGLSLTSNKIAARITLDSKTSIITEGELNQKLQENELFKRSGGKIPPQLAKFFIPQILDNTIDEHILALKAESEAVDVKAEVDKAIEQIYQRVGGKEKAAKLNINLPALRKRMAGQIKNQKLIERVVGGRKVDEELVKKYYEESKAQEFKTPDGKGFIPYAQVKQRIIDKFKALITDEDIEDYYNTHKERWRKPDKGSFRRFMINPMDEKRLEAVKFTEDELKDYYESHKSDFLGQKKYNVSHIFLSPTDEKLISSIKISDDDIKKRYEENKNDYIEEEEVKTACILFKIEDEKDETAVKAAQEKADKAFQRIVKGEDFAKVAKELSEDKLSKDRGGEGEFWPRGMKDQKTEDAVFTLDKGALTKPVRTARGIEIFKVLDRKKAVTKKVEEVREEIVEQLKSEKAEDACKDQLKKLKEKLLDKELSFEEAAKRHSQAKSAQKELPGMLSPLVLGENKGNPDIDEVGEDGFVDYSLQNVLKEGNTGLFGPIQSAKGFHLLKLHAVIQPEVLPLDVCREDVTKQYRSYLADQVAHQLVVALREEALSKKKSFEDIVKEHSDGADKANGGLWSDIMLDAGVKPEMDQKVLEQTDSRYGLNKKIVNALKQLKPGDISQPVRIGTTYQLFQLVKIAPAAYEPLDGEVKKEIKFALNPSVDEEEMKKFFKENADKYKKPAKVIIQHVMVASEAKAEKVLADAVAGKDFDKLVSQHSIDFASKKRGGTISQEHMPKIIKEQVEKIEAGKVVPKVINSGVGFHVVKLLKRETEKTPSFEDNRTSIKDELLRPRLNDLLRSYVKELRRQAVVETWDGPDKPLLPKMAGSQEAAPHLSATSPDLKPEKVEKNEKAGTK